LHLQIQMDTRSSDNWSKKPGGWDSLNLTLLDSEEDWPEINCTKANVEYIVNVNDRKKIAKGCTVSTFIDDYHLERLWNQPVRYGNRFLHLEVGNVMSPDFSLFIGMPKPMMIWNTYRSRMVGRLWADMGLNVIPTVTWADHNSFEFCFEGIAKGSIVAISDVGIRNNEERYYFDLGYHKMIDVIKPRQILFMTGKKSRPLYEHEDVVFLDSFFTKKRKQWAAEANQKIKETPTSDNHQEQILL
jgi:hypothetical protein